MAGKYPPTLGDEMGNRLYMANLEMIMTRESTSCSVMGVRLRVTHIMYKAQWPCLIENGSGTAARLYRHAIARRDYSFDMYREGCNINAQAFRNIFTISFAQYSSEHLLVHSEESPARPMLFYSTNYWQQFWMQFVV